MCVMAVYVTALAYEAGLAAVQISSVIGILCAFCDLPLYRSLLDAENLERERMHVQLLAQQVEVQEQALADARLAAREADGIRARLAHELALAEDALARADGDAACERLAGADQALTLSRAHVCQHPAADAIIQAKLGDAEKAGIRVTCSAQLPFDMPTPAAELSAVVANVWDNAIDACRALPPCERWIEFSAREAHGFVAVDVRNSCSVDAVPAAGGRRRAESARNDGQRFRNGSLPRHGWGLTIIEGVARRHAGSVEYGREDGIFHLSAIWQLDQEGGEGEYARM